MTPDPYMIRAHVPDWEGSVADYRAASRTTRLANPDRRTVAYGPGEDEVLDVYTPSASAGPRPIHLFVHGGYWRAFSKDDYAFVADAVLAEGAVAAVMDYALMPRARMATLVDQVRRAVFWLGDHAAALGADPTALSVSGHSAGAHLASFLLCRAAHEPDVPLPAVRSVLLVSGLYDLEPLTRSFLQPEVALTPEEVSRWSPLRATPDTHAAVTLLVGETETAPFHDQARLFAAHLAEAGVAARLTTMPGLDHMAIVREMGRPGTAAAARLSDAIRTSRTP